MQNTTMPEQFPCFSVAPAHLYRYRQVVTARSSPRASHPSIVQYSVSKVHTLPPPHTRCLAHLQLLLSIHKPALDPHPVPPIASHTLTVQELRQGRLDLLVDVEQFLLVFDDLNFWIVDLRDGKSGGERGAAFWEVGTSRRCGGLDGRG